MAYETGTEPTPKDLFDHLVAQLQDDAFMGSGNEWELKYSYDGWASSDTVAKRVIKTLLVPGPSTAGDYHLCLQIVPSTGTNTTNLLWGALKADPVPPFGGDTWVDAGTWSSASVSYTRGQVVKQSSSFYVCDVNHTSAAGTQPGTAGGATNWRLITDTTWFGTFLSSALAHAMTASSGYCAKVWNGGTGDIKYWLVANASRLVLVTKSDSRYHFAYVGGYVPIGSVAGNLLPTLLTGNSSTPSNTYLNSANRNFPVGVGSDQLSTMGCPGNLFAAGSEIMPFPPGGYTAPFAPVGRRVDGNYPLIPILLGFLKSAGSDLGVVGTMDGVFITDTRGSVSENIITHGGVDHLVVEDVYRGESGHFLAIKLA